MILPKLSNLSPAIWQPHSYQEKARNFLLSHPNGALFLDPGLGKTSITLAALLELRKKMPLKVLVIAPLRVCYDVWPKEIEQWANFNGITYSILHGLRKGTALQQDVELYIINPDGLSWLFANPKLPEFNMLIIDELSKFKHVNTQRFKKLRKYLASFEYRWGLTGSPAANGLLDLFGQALILDMGKSLGSYITHYRLTYFTNVRPFIWTLKSGADKLIYEKLDDLALRIGDDVLDMPELVNNNIRVSLPSQAMTLYRKLEQEMIVLFEQQKITAASAAALSTKCRQIANGAVYTAPNVDPSTGLLEPRTKKWTPIHDAKLLALKDLIDELQGKPLLVAYEFEHDVARLRDDFPHGVFTGDYPVEKLPSIIKKWNNGEIPVLFGHPQSIGHGLNLQKGGNHICWFSLTWNYELYDQFNRRLLRQGNENSHVYIHHLIAEDTIDEVLLKSLQRKEKGQRALFSAIEALYAIRSQGQ
jgi:SNF2 family DNA or RNA helicase